MFVFVCEYFFSFEEKILSEEKAELENENSFCELEFKMAKTRYFTKKKLMDKKGGGDILISKEESGSHLQERGISDVGDVQKS